MGKVDTEEIPALVEEVEGELFNVSLVDNEEEGAIEGILPDVRRDAIVEENPEDAVHDQVRDEGHWELEEEEVKIVAEETKTVRIPAQYEGICVFFLLVKSILQIFVEVDEGVRG